MEQRVTIRIGRSDITKKYIKWIGSKQRRGNVIPFDGIVFDILFGFCTNVAFKYILYFGSITQRKTMPYGVIRHVLWHYNTIGPIEHQTKTIQIRNPFFWLGSYHDYLDTQPTISSRTKLTNAAPSIRRSILGNFKIMKYAGVLFSGVPISQWMSMLRFNKDQFSIIDTFCSLIGDEQSKIGFLSLQVFFIWGMLIFDKQWTSQTREHALIRISPMISGLACMHFFSSPVVFRRTLICRRVLVKTKLLVVKVICKKDSEDFELQPHLSGPSGATSNLCWRGSCHGCRTSLHGSQWSVWNILAPWSSKGGSCQGLTFVCWTTVEMWTTISECTISVVK